MQRKFKPISIINLCLTVMIICVEAVHADTSFVRFVSGNEEWQGELQTAIVSYRNRKGVIVDLVSAIHIAEEEYYDYLNKYFAGQDAVLYELIANENDRPTPETPIDNLSAISFVQRILGNLLNVSFQLEQIDYSPMNFLHADLTPVELAQIMFDKDENFFSMFLTLVVSQFAEEQIAIRQGKKTTSFDIFSIADALMAEDQAVALKYLFAEQLGRTDGIIVGPELERQITILGDRNKAALDVLAETLSDPTIRRISIFYGAAHMPGIERELLNSFGFEQTEQLWLSAWVTP